MWACNVACKSGALDFCRFIWFMWHVCVILRGSNVSCSWDVGSVLVVGEKVRSVTLGGYVAVSIMVMSRFRGLFLP